MYGKSKNKRDLDIGLSYTSAPIPTAIVGFVMLEPKITPNDISLDFFIKPITATVNSGNAELKPISIDPIND